MIRKVYKVSGFTVYTHRIWHVISEEDDERDTCQDLQGI
jgi:hypothetical protein